MSQLSTQGPALLFGSVYTDTILSNWLWDFQGIFLLCIATALMIITEN